MQTQCTSARLGQSVLPAQAALRQQAKENATHQEKQIYNLHAIVRMLSPTRELGEKPATVLD